MDKDGYDYATAIKDVGRLMPEAAEEILEYVEKLKKRLPVEIDETAEKGELDG